MERTSSASGILSAAAGGKSLLLVAGLLAVVTCLVVIADPYVSELLPRRWWQFVYLADLPYKLTPLLAVSLIVLAAVSWALWRVGSVADVCILLLLIASQANGFRIAVIDPFDVTLVMVFLVCAGAWLSGAHTRMTAGLAVGLALALIILNLPNIVHGNAVRFLAGSLSLTRCLLIAILLPSLVSSPRSFDFAMRAFMVIAVLSALIGIVQFMASYFFSAYFTLIDPPESAFKPTPIGMVMRSSALCITAQHFSGFLTLALPFMLFAFTEANGRSRFTLAAGLILVGLGILLSWNFGAILVAAGTVGLFPLFRWPRFAIHILVAYLLIAGVAYFSGLLELFYDLSFGDSGVAKGVSQRKTLMALGFTKLYRDPWLGEGVFGMARFSGNFWGRPVHNAYVQTMTEVGMIGGWILIAALLAIVTQLLLAGIKTRGRSATRMRASLMAMVALMVLMMSEPMMDNSNTWLMLGLAEGALLVNLDGRRFRLNMPNRTLAPAATATRPSSSATAVTAPTG
jgi:hypothetical protein